MKNDTSNIPGFVYILQSQLNSKYYIGSTINVEKRFSEHQNGFVKSTKNIRLLELKFYKKYDSITYARKIEYKLKKMKNKNLIEKIILNRDIKITV
jgi:putative endonuclease